MNNAELKPIGYFLKRNDISNITITNLIVELQSHKFEAIIMSHAIQNYQNLKLSAFDSSIGDWKCQTRSSILTDYEQNKDSFNQALSKELLFIQTLISHLDKHLYQINFLSHAERQKFTKKLQSMSIQTYFLNNSLTYTPPPKLVLLSLCFLTTPQNQHLDIFTNNTISTNKVKEFINTGKTALCKLSIEYEQLLAKKYCDSEIQRVLEVIEFKGIQYMSAIFPSFIAIYQKMLAEHQAFIINNITFCLCGGILPMFPQVFIPSDNIFLDIAKANEFLKEKTLTAIESYQFPGSIIELQNLLGIPNNETYIPKEYYRPCTCNKPNQPKPITNFHDAIMAFFAQHPQFTNGSEINFDKLELSQSNFKKKYEYFLSLNGFNRNDMSIFYIRHMYPSTIETVLNTCSLLNAHYCENNNHKH